MQPIAGRGGTAPRRRLFSVHADTAIVYPEWRREWRRIVLLYEVEGKQVHDAQIAAAAHMHGVTHLLTYNVGDFKRCADFLTAVAPGRIGIIAMMQGQEPGKRIVSKGAYVKAWAGKVFLSLVLIGMVCYSASNMMKLWLKLPSMPNSKTLSSLLSVCLLMTGGFCIMIIAVIRFFAYLKRTGTGVPLTRANTADLPAPDSLVRASQQPARAQEAILLRPTTQTQDGHTEQLLRAAGERE